MAWISEQAYRDSSGNPGALPFSGKTGSFERLVKDYSGDIPARAMFLEMRRLRMIRRDASNNVQLVRAGIAISRNTNRALNALSPWIGFLSKTDEQELIELNADTIQIALNFQTMPELFSAVRELQRRAAAFVNSIHELRDRKKVRRGCKLDISFALGTRVPSADSAARSIQGRGNV